MPVSEIPENVVTDEFNRLRGRLCGLIESWGLPEKQERGAIQTLKSLSYDSEKVVKDLIENIGEPG
jgi:hypothetical protein